jgi:hypothetical protein
VELKRERRASVEGVHFSTLAISRREDVALVSIGQAQLRGLARRLPRRFGEEPRRDPNPDTVSYLRYAEDTGRFVSEFGLHAAPVYETLRRAVPPDQLYHHSPSMVQGGLKR